MIHVTWTGAAGLCFQTDQETILIDPYYTRIGILATLFAPLKPDTAAIEQKLSQMADISAIIVSHTHSDHVLDVPYLAGRCDCKVVGSPSLSALMRINQMPQRTTICQGGEEIALGKSAALTMILSTHGLMAFGKVPFDGKISPEQSLPMKAKDYRVGTVFAPKLALNGTVFQHTASAGFLEQEMSGHSCDVLFLCVTGWKKSPGYPERLMDLTRPQCVVLFHYDDFSKPHQKGRPTRRMPFLDMDGLKNRIRSHSPRADIRVPEVGDTLIF